MKKTKIKIVIEVDEEMIVTDDQLLRVVQDEVKAFSKNMHTIGVRCDYEILEETSKAF